MSGSVLQQVQKHLGDLGINFSLTGRYARQKLTVIGGYVLASLLTVGWAFSSSQPLANAIGASIEAQVIPSTGEQWILLRNNSSDNWSDVRLLLNDRYLFIGPESVTAGESARVFVKDFDYLLYVPRARHFGTLEDTSEEPPQPKASATLKPTSLTLSCDQGFHTIAF